MSRVTLCDHCAKPIERGDHAADGFTFELEGLTIRVAIETPAGKERPDLHRACLRAKIGRAEIRPAHPVMTIVNNRAAN